MSKKKISLIVLVVCLSLLMAVAVGCSNSDTEKTTTEPKTVTFTDSAERQVEVPAKVTKIVPSGPLAQIALFALAGIG
jgi:iron complex transport system substrate-binding protein